MAESPRDIDELDISALKALVLELLGKVAELERTVGEQRAEIARLKGLSGPPDIKASGMDGKARPRAKPGRGADKGRRGAKKGRVRIDERRIVAGAVPAGSRFKGYEDYLVQDLVCRPHNVLLRRERWLTPEGVYVVAPLPAGTRGHFGAELRRFVLAQYHGAQTSVEAPPTRGPPPAARRARRPARGSLPWTTGTSPHPARSTFLRRRAGTFLRRR